MTTVYHPLSKKTIPILPKNSARNWKYCINGKTYPQDSLFEELSLTGQTSTIIRDFMRLPREKRENGARRSAALPGNTGRDRKRRGGYYNKE